MTGRHHARSGVSGVLFPNSPVGLPLNEETIAERLRTEGYRTEMVGKWHLGDQAGMRPWERGFDRFFGVLNSNDMCQFELLDNGILVNGQPDQELLHAELFARARQAIVQAAAGTQPLFLLVSLVTPHVPVHVHPSFQGSSGRGLYADALREMDAGFGSLLQELQVQGMDASTLVIFTSDNGPWINSHGPPSGHPEPWRWVGGLTGGLRGAKGLAFEGGVRVPLRMRFPGRIAAGTVLDAPASMLDIFPTLLEAAALNTAMNRRYDGRSLLASTPPDWEQCVYRMFHADSGMWGTRRLWSYRNERWKLFFDNQGQPTELYDLQSDPAESTPVSDAGRMATLSDRARQFHCQLDAGPGRTHSTTNLAQGARASSSASWQCSTANLACDGSTLSGYESPGCNAAWLALDLGAVRDISSQTVLFGASLPTQLVIERSLDGVNWQTLAAFSAWTGSQLDLPIGCLARHVRLRTSATAGGAGLSVLEWRVLGATHSGGSGSGTAGG